MESRTMVLDGRGTEFFPVLGFYSAKFVRKSIYVFYQKCNKSFKMLHLVKSFKKTSASRTKKSLKKTLLHGGEPRFFYQQILWSARCENVPRCFGTKVKLRFNELRSLSRITMNVPRHGFTQYFVVMGNVLLANKMPHERYT